MKYAALISKLKAMSAKAATDKNGSGRAGLQPNNFKPLSRKAATKLCRYIPCKRQRDYVMAATQDTSLNHYIAQWKRLNRLDKPNRIALKSTLGAEIDLNNILWMYRLKRYHRVTGNATFGHLIPIRYMLSREATRRMADCTTPKALLDEIASSPYAADFIHLAEKENNTRIGQPTPEEMLAKAITRRYQTAARRYPNTLAPVLAYLAQFREQ